MPTLADCLPQSQRAFIEGIAADRETQANKRAALVERDGHPDWKGERCAPCTYCGSIFVASALRAMNGAALACKRCNAERAGNG
jgi:hypothetical protein